MHPTFGGSSRSQIMTTESRHSPFPAGARASRPSPNPWARAPCGPRLGVLFVAMLLVVSLPADSATDEQLEAALSLIQPPSDSDLKQILDLTCDSGSGGTATAERLSDLYGSRELRRRIAEIYTRYLTLQDLRYLQKAFDSEVFRKYKRVAPLIFVEVLELEEETIRRYGIGSTRCRVYPTSSGREAFPSKNRRPEPVP